MGILGSSWKDEESSNDEPVIKHFKSETKDTYVSILSRSEDTDNIEDLDEYEKPVISHFKD